MPHEKEALAPDPLALLCAADLDLLIGKLLAYASYRTSRQKADDYVQEAVKLLLDGTRHCEAADEAALFAVLCGVIDSLISHDAEKMKRRGRHVSLASSRPDDDERDVIAEDRIASSDDVEGGVILHDRLSRFLQSLDDHDLETYAAMRATESCATAEEYANVLRLPIAEVRNMDRRLRRRRAQW